MNKPTSETFLSWMFAAVLAKRPDFRIATWSTPSKKTLFHSTVTEAAAAANQISGKENAYFAVCPLSSVPAPDKNGKQGRGSLENYGALVALWADIDLKDSVHKKQNLPSSIEEAMLLIEDLKVEPSVVTHSGHGIQVFWLLKEPWIFQSPEERKKAQEFTELWHKTLKYFAGKRGWEVDSVFDLPRILRVPGTLNIKDPQDPREVQFIEPVFTPASGDVERHSLDALECFTLAPELLVSAATKAARPKVQVEPVLPSAKSFPLSDFPPSLKTMAENDPTFKRTLERQRKDLSDQSPSSYDMSLANQMAMAGCADQEIADAIAWWRAKHCPDPKDAQKAYRRDYLMRTLSRVRTDLGAARSLDMVAETPLETLEVEDKAKREEAKGEILKNVSQGLGVGIRRIIKMGKEKSRYCLVLESGEEIGIGGLGELLNQNVVRVALGDATGILIRMIKMPQWHEIVQRLLRVVDYVDNQEASTRGVITQWLSAYLSSDHIPDESHGEDDLAQAHRKGQPYIEGGLYHISSLALARYIRVNFDDSIKKGDVWDALRAEGWVSGQKNKLVNKKQVNKSLWTKPVEAKAGD